jgi:hypothetical protein
MIHDLAGGSYGKFLRCPASYSMAYICRNSSASSRLVIETLVAAASMSIPSVISMSFAKYRLCQSLRDNIREAKSRLEKFATTTIYEILIYIRTLVAVETTS